MHFAGLIITPLNIHSEMKQFSTFREKMVSSLKISDDRMCYYIDEKLFLSQFLFWKYPIDKLIFSILNMNALKMSFNVNSMKLVSTDDEVSQNVRAPK